MKKFISVMMCVLLLLGCALPAFAADDSEHPTIYVTGAQTNDLYNADGERIYPLSDDVDAMQIIKDALKPCLEKLALGMLTDDYEAYAQEFYNAFVPIYEDIALDKNGEVSDGSHPRYTIYNSQLPQKMSGYQIWDYRFWYDWRISPMVAADELKIYIDMVKDATGEKKVNLMGRCYGANVIAAYLEKYEEHALASVDDVAYLSSSVLGIDMLAAIFSGELFINAQALDDFVNYFMDKENLVEDEALNVFILSLVELFNQVKVLQLSGDALKLLVDRLKYDLIPLVVRDTFGSMPAYWSMVTPELYEQAIDFIYAGCKDEYKNLIAKTDDYYYNVQLDAKDSMLEFKENGIDFNIFVKYNFPDYPIYEDATALGDGTTKAVRQGFGGLYADFGTVFPDKYINSLQNKTYLSPDLKINAATCLFPNNTWFIKDMHHDIFADCLNWLAINSMNDEATVSTDGYTQFLAYENGALTAIEGVDEDAEKEPDSPLKSLLRFLQSFFKVFRKLISGGIGLGNLFA